MLGVLAIADADDVDDINGDCPLRCRNTDKRSGVAAGNALSGRNLVAFSNLIQHLDPEVGQTRMQNIVKGMPWTFPPVVLPRRC